jgi:hypothetical protein
LTHGTELALKAVRQPKQPSIPSRTISRSNDHLKLLVYESFAQYVPNLDLAANTRVGPPDNCSHSLGDNRSPELTEIRNPTHTKTLTSPNATTRSIGFHHTPKHSQLRTSFLPDEARRCMRGLYQHTSCPAPQKKQKQAL